MASRTKSPLSVLTKLSPNRTSPRKNAITRLTPHCMAGNMTIESAGNWFAKSSTNASAQYGIGTDGRLATYCKETDRSWCTSSAANDNRAITVEIANDGGAPQWHMSDKAINTFIDLGVDVAKFYGFNRVGYYGSLANSVEKPDELMITLHCWFANKACPGPYLISLLPSLVTEMNSRLDGNAPRVFTSGSFQRPVLKLGSKGDAVKQAQTRLNLHGAKPELSVDGSFGSSTEAAVRIFQVNRQLSVDGIIGPSTWACLDREPEQPLPLPKPADPVTGFTDVADHWAYDSIVYLFKKGIVNGTTATTFDPNDQVTRGAFLKMLHVVSGDPDPIIGDYFSDVAPNAWYAPCMYWAFNSGIISGKGNGLGAPNDKLTRGEMAVMLSRYLGLSGPNVSQIDEYTDHLEIPSWVAPCAYALKAAGIMSGMVGNRFCSNETATRAEAATVLARALKMEKK